MKTTNSRMDGVQMGVASDWAGLSLRRLWVSAGVSVRAVRVNALALCCIITVIEKEFTYVDANGS
jgi:hypothetical protein